MKLGALEIGVLVILVVVVGVCAVLGFGIGRAERRRRTGLCPQCGRANPDRAKFCEGCGAFLKTAVQQSSVTQEVASGQPDKVDTGTFCPQCGRANPDRAKFCEECGAFLKTAVQKSSVTQTVVSPQTMIIVGTVGVVLILVGFFAPWITASGWMISINFSAWDLLRGVRLDGETTPRPLEIYLAFIGVLLGLAGAVSGFTSPKARHWTLLMLLAGIFSVVAAGKVLLENQPVATWGAVVSIGYGAWLTLLGGVLCLGSLLRLRRS